MSRFVHIREVDRRTDHLVMGYIRNIQKLFPDNIAFYIIPELAQYECLKFYYIPERFVKCGKYMRMSGDAREV